MLAFLLALVSSIVIPPKPAKYVTDNAHVLDAARASALNEKLAQFERDTSNQVLVYVDRKLPADTTIEQMGSEAMHQWGVGQKGKDNGAVLFLFIDDRKMRIEVGYGLEPVLTDAKSREITSTIIKPRLKANDYNGAVEQGAGAMLAAARGQESKGTGRTVQEVKRHTRTVLPVEAATPSYWGFDSCVVVFVLGALGVIILLAVVLGRRRGSGFTTGSAGTSGTTSSTLSDSSSSSWSSSSSSDFSSSSSSSSDSSSGFSGGGGDAGGGGSSDSW